MLSQTYTVSAQNHVMRKRGGKEMKKLWIDNEIEDRKDS